jgi:hypothetical protein
MLPPFVRLSRLYFPASTKLMSMESSMLPDVVEQRRAIVEKPWKDPMAADRNKRPSPSHSATRLTTKADAQQ